MSRGRNGGRVGARREPFSPKFLTDRQDSSFIFIHQSRFLSVSAWEHPDPVPRPVAAVGLARSNRWTQGASGSEGKSAPVAGPGSHFRQQYLQAIERQPLGGTSA